MTQEAKNAENQRLPSNLFPAKAEPSSPFYAMLQSASEDYLLQQEEQHTLPPDFPVYYFFYGTLTVPSQLQRIIDLPEEPKLRKAEIFGYTIAKWGDYPALINSRQGQVGRSLCMLAMHRLFSSNDLTGNYGHCRWVESLDNTPYTSGCRQL